MKSGTKGKKKENIKTHKKGGKLVCEICGFKAKTARGTTVHKTRKHGKDGIEVVPPMITKIQKQREFQLYLILKGLAPLAKKLDARKIEALGMTEDEDVKEVLMMKTQEEFAKKFKIDKNTLSEWNKKISITRLVSANTDIWKRLITNVYAAFYTKTLEDPSAANVRLYSELFGGLEPEGAPKDTGPKVVNQQFIQNIINLNAEYDKKHEQIYRDAIKDGEVPSSE